jgi:hypothetical protein
MSQNIEQMYRTQMILWLAFLMSQMVLLVVIFSAKPELFKFDLTKPIFEPIAIAVAFISVINIGLSFVFRNKYLKESIQKQSVALVQQGNILAYAFCESVCIFGVVLAFSDYQYFFAWFLLGIAGILVHLPNRSHLIDATYKNDRIS